MIIKHLAWLLLVVLQVEAVVVAVTLGVLIE